jgi:hypothetical protein
MTMTTQTFLTFDTGADARTWRHTHGTGGWIFVDEADGRATLFPPDMTPTAIFRHPLTRGRSGDLIGHG